MDRQKITGKVRSLDSLNESISFLDSELRRTLSSLKRRSLVETDLTSGCPAFFLQPVIAKYVFSKFVERVAAELDRSIGPKREPWKLFANYPLSCPFARRNPLQSLVRLVKRRCQRQQSIFSFEEYTGRLNKILLALKEVPSLETGYAIENLKMFLYAAQKEL